MSATAHVTENEVSAEEWDGYVNAHPAATFFHQYRWLTLIQKTYGGTPHYLAAREQGQLVGVLPLMQRQTMGAGRVMISVPYADEGGLIADHPAAQAALLQSARDLGEREKAAHIEVRGLAPVTNHPCDLSRVVLRLSLPSDADGFLTGLSKNMRKKVRRAQRDGLTTTAGAAEHLDAFYLVYSENMRDLGSPMHSQRFFSALFDFFPNQTLSILVQSAKQSVVGAAVAVQFGDVLTVLCAHSLRRHYQLFPNNLLYWALCEAAIKRRCNWADFGRSPKGTGIYEFKKLWGMEDQQLYYEMIAVRHSPKIMEKRDSNLYRIFSSVWRKTPLPVARALGPRIFARLPL